MISTLTFFHIILPEMVYITLGRRVPEKPKRELKAINYEHDFT